MSRLQSEHYSRIQPDVIHLLHDEVISLCQRQYGGMRGLEIDGIICISLLDTKEQQVVKIHKTLKSVAPQRSAYPNIASMLSTTSDVRDQRSLNVDQRSNMLYDLVSNEETRLKSGSEERAGEPNFQRDINHLSEILKISKNSSLSSSEDTAKSSEQRVSKRKIKAPKHHIQESVSQAPHVELPNSESNLGTGEIRVKDEPYDQEYEQAMEPKIVNIEGGVRSDDKKSEPVSENNKTVMPVSSYIHRLIDKEIKNTDYQQMEEPEKSVQDINTDVVVKEEIQEELAEDDSKVTGNSASISGSDVNDDAQSNDKDYDVNIEEPMNDQIKEWLYRDILRKNKQAQKEKHWLYGIAKSSLACNSDFEIRPNESVKMALADKVFSGRTVGSAPSPPPRRAANESNMSWIERVKQNVNKYQAALMRTHKEKSATPEATVASPGSQQTPSTSGTKPSSQNTDFLKALLKQAPAPRFSSSSSVADITAIAPEMDLAGVDRASRARNEHQERSRSLSPTPVVKIEVDDDDSPYSSATDANSNTAAAVAAMSFRPQGKLESRYPALFNQLQQVKKGNDNYEGGDSLVNRLPFISFQELFSQATTSTSSTEATTSAEAVKGSESTTLQLLDQAKIRPDNQRVTPPKKRSVWKWKKRLVRPKDEHGKPLSSLPLSPAQFAQVSDATAQGMNTSSNRFFMRKRSRGDKEDKPYKPHKSRKVIEKLLSDVKEERNTSSVRTRLSSGEKKKINFAEINDSDVDSDDVVTLDEDEEEDEGAQPSGASKMELVSAFCSNNCGSMFASLSDLQEHENVCEFGSKTGSGSGSDTVSMATGPFRCTVCGLEFNQMYRLHYHLIKVHGIAADEAGPFR